MINQPQDEHLCSSLPMEARSAYLEDLGALDATGLFMEGDGSEYDARADELARQHRCGLPARHHADGHGWLCPRHAVGIFWYGRHPEQIISGWLETTFDLNQPAPCCGGWACDECQSPMRRP